MNRTALYLAMFVFCWVIGWIASEQNGKAASALPAGGEVRTGDDGTVAAIPGNGEPAAPAYDSPEEYESAYHQALKARMSDEILEEILIAYAADFPERALDFVLDYRSINWYLIDSAEEVIEAAVLWDAEKTWNRLLEAADGDHHKGGLFLGWYADALGKHDPEAALDMLDEVKPGKKFQEVTRALGKVAFGIGPDRAVEFFKSLPPYMESQVRSEYISGFREKRRKIVDLDSRERIVAAVTLMDDMQHLLAAIDYEVKAAELRGMMISAVADLSLEEAAEVLQANEVEGDEEVKLALMARKVHRLPYEEIDEFLVRYPALADKWPVQHAVASRRVQWFENAPLAEATAFWDANPQFVTWPEVKRSYLSKLVDQDPSAFISKFEQAELVPSSFYSVDNFESGFSRWLGDHPAEAANAVSTIQDQTLKMVALQVVIHNLVGDDDFVHALEWVAKIPDEEQRRKNFDEVHSIRANHYVREDWDIEKAHESVNAIRDPEERRDVSNYVNDAHAYALLNEEKFEAARERAAMIEDESMRDSALDTINNDEVWLHIDNGDFDAAREAAQQIIDGEGRANLAEEIRKAEEEWRAKPPEAEPQ